jgi:UDP-N-acetylmuramyl tripeptide synthase
MMFAFLVVFLLHSGSFYLLFEYNVLILGGISMRSFKFYVALWMAKLSIPALKITHHNGTDYPGHLALKICPDFLFQIGKPELIIAVTGTNGKTTCSNMICDAFAAQGRKVLCNRYGSNINSGISTCLITGATMSGKAKYAVAVLETDERSAPKLYPALKPQYIVVTNLFRDSIMRNGHPEYIAWILSKNIPKESRLVLNGDDLISSGIAPENPRVYYGINKLDTDVTECENLLNDMRICPRCGAKLTYDYRRYHHIGKAHCSNCDFRSPEYDYAGHDIDFNNMTIEVSDRETTGTYHIPNDSIFNIYNAVMTVALFRDMGVSAEELKGLMEKVKIPDTRFNVRKAGSVSIVTQLAKDKNALAVTRATDYVRHLPGHKRLFLLISCYKDEHVWSENTCWLYDADFEMMNDPLIDQCVVTGPRALDFKLRLLYAGVPEEKILCVLDEREAASEFDINPGDGVYIFCGIDAFDLVDDCREIIRKRCLDAGL